MKAIKIVTLLLLASVAGRAQDFKIPKSSGRLEINIGKVSVEGSTGNEIIFSSSDNDKDDDERRKGLVEINGSGLEDNTGLGINVDDKGGVITVRQLKKTSNPHIRIQVPKGVIVSYSYESQYGSDVEFLNMENEIEIAAQYNSVTLNNVTGPLTAKCIYGHIETVFDTNVKGPISIVSVYGYADVTLPVSVKANLRLSTSYGEIYVAPTLKIEVDRASSDEDRVTGKMNGGGMNIDISSNYGKVYLRKK